MANWQRKVDFSTYTEKYIGMQSPFELGKITVESSLEN